MPVDNLFTTPLFSKFIKRKITSKNLICVSPDMGGVARTRALATRLKADLAIIDKRRPAPGKSEVMNIIGDVKNKTCIIVDDIIDSGGTIINAVDALKKKGAKEVYVFITHAVLSGDASNKIKNSTKKIDYEVADPNVKFGKTIYYKISQYDFDNKSNFTEIISVESEPILNVFYGNSLINYTLNKKGKQQLNIYNLNGQLLYKETVEGSGSIPWDKPGFYIIEIPQLGLHQKLIIQ